MFDPNFVQIEYGYYQDLTNSYHYVSPFQRGPGARLIGEDGCIADFSFYFPKPCSLPYHLLLRSIHRVTNQIQNFELQDDTWLQGGLETP